MHVFCVCIMNNEYTAGRCVCVCEPTIHVPEWWWWLYQRLVVVLRLGWWYRATASQFSTDHPPYHTDILHTLGFLRDSNAHTRTFTRFLCTQSDFYAVHMHTLGHLHYSFAHTRTFTRFLYTHSDFYAIPIHTFGLLRDSYTHIRTFTLFICTHFDFCGIHIHTLDLLRDSYVIVHTRTFKRFLCTHADFYAISMYTRGLLRDSYAHTRTFANRICKFLSKTRKQKCKIRLNRLFLGWVTIKLQKKITIPCLKGNYQLSVCDTLDKHTNIVIFYIYILFLSFISDSGDK